MPQWKHQIMKSVHKYVHNELKAFFALCIYICIMCWQAIWEKNVKAVKGLSKGTLGKFLHFTTESCQNPCYLTPWLLYAYIYAQSEKAFNSQCKHSIVLRHVFFKKWTIAAVSDRKSIASSGWCGVWLPSLFWPSFMGRGCLTPFTPSPTPGGIRQQTSLKYHM